MTVIIDGIPDRVAGQRSGTVFGLSRRAVRGTGAEGVVISVSNGRVVKLLTEHMTPERSEKLWALVQLGFDPRWPAEAIMPQEPVVELDSRRLRGWLMTESRGGTLHDTIYSPEFVGMKYDARLEVALSIAQTFATIHELKSPKVVIGDVKTSNMMLDSMGLMNRLLDRADGKPVKPVVNLIDLESVGLYGVRGLFSGPLQDFDSTIRTPGYAPKELALDKDLPTTQACDLHALGVVLFEVLFGQLPRSERGMADMEPVPAVMGGHYPRFKFRRDRWPKYPLETDDMSEEMLELFRAALFMGPADRPSARRWLEGITRWGQSLKPPPPAPVLPTDPTPLPQPAKRGWRFWR